MPSPDTVPSLQVFIQDTDLSFPCRSRQPVLEAAHAAGIDLLYACRRGICGLCAADLVQGDVAPIDARPFTHARCRPEQVLLCRCTPVNGAITIRPSPWNRQSVARRLPPL